MKNDIYENITYDGSEDSLKKILARRQFHRINKNFKKADEIRLMLKELGIEVEDRSNGVVWKINKI